MELPELLEIAAKERQAQPPSVIRCCVAAGCVSSGSQAVLETMRKSVKQAGLADQIKVCGVGCMRLCCQGPLVEVDERRGLTPPVSTQNRPLILYQRVTSQNAGSIVDALQGRESTAEQADLTSPFFALQASVVLE